jgi:hypothetical protein
MIVTAASTIAVAVVAVLVVVTFVTFSSRPVTIAPTRAARARFFDTVIAESYFALLAIAFDIIVWGVVGFGGLPWLEAAELRYCCLVGICHRCCQYGSVR